jgi:hypothetical protein
MTHETTARWSLLLPTTDAGNFRTLRLGNVPAPLNIHPSTVFIKDVTVTKPPVGYIRDIECTLSPDGGSDLKDVVVFGALGQARREGVGRMSPGQLVKPDASSTIL